MLIGQQIGPFFIQKELGSGAMGSVYLTQFERKGKMTQAALKVISLGLLGNESAMARFEREAAILKQLRHPHIVRLLATGKYRSTPFIAMEFVDGESMDRALARRGRLSWEEVFEYGVQLCDALQHAHEKGIIHRDLKPSNLMITREGVLKLTDFGIAKDTDVTALTGANSTIGTAAYMSPEQCKGFRDLTAKSDLYSLGVVLFELITGRKPFTAESTVDMFLKHVNEKPPRPSRQVADLPPLAESLILQLMEKEPDKRPLDALRVKDAMAEILRKSHEQASLGLAAANARRIDGPPVGGALTDEDREAARALKGKKKKKKKVKHVPLAQRKWVKAAVFGTVFLGILGAAAYLFWPKGMDAAFAEFEKAPDKLDAAKRFLASHGTSTDERVEKVRAAFRDEQAKQRESQLAKRSKNFRKAQDGEDQAALDHIWAAMEAEQAGNLARAKEAWTAARDKFPDAPPDKYADEDATNRAAFRWAADRRLAEIAAVPGELGRLRRQVRSEADIEDRKKYDATDPEWLAVKAVRLTSFPDLQKARQVWDQLAKETAEKTDKFRWFLLASEQRSAIPTDAKKEEEAAAARRLNHAAQLDVMLKELDASKGDDARTNVATRQLRLACRNVTELFADDPTAEMKALVARAEKLLQDNPK